MTPEQIGRYRILDLLGEGGMGTVYKAEQNEPVRRLVAVKVIKLGMDSKDVIARFELERRALASMSHHCIAKVFDAGATERGQPYFVMEFVQGLPLTDYCNEHRLSLEQRIDLFRQVCAGVQHAHQKGVIHRDLKPGNILVAREGDKAVPKILDFGLAKATNRELVVQSIYTENSRLLGTPEYMAPEQATGTDRVIDVRADIYSLGVILFELLAGELPFRADELRKAGWLEMRRILAEQEPPKPSTKISAIGYAAVNFAHQRRTNLRGLSRALRGDLDWIVLKSLAKEPERRYDSAVGLAMDLQRHLDHEPVLAGPPSAAYRLRKMLRRHRAQFVSAALVFLALLAGIVAFAIENARARGNARIARAQETRANERATTARAIRDFLVGLFEASSPYEARGEPMTVRKYLDLGAARLATLGDQPATRAELEETLGHLFTLHSEFDKAEPLILSAIRYREAQADTNPTALARALHMLANVYNWTNENNKAETLIRRAIAIHERELGDSPHLAQNLNTLGNTLQRLGKLDEAEKAHRRALAIRERLLPANHVDIAQTLHNLGILRYFSGDLAAAAELYERAIEIERAAHEPDSHDVATSLHTLAIVYCDQWRLTEALALQREALSIREKVLGPKHDHVALSLTVLGRIHREMGQLEESERQARRAVQISQANLDTTHPELWWQQHTLVRTLFARAKWDDAATVLESLHAAAEKAKDGAAQAKVHGVRGRLHLEQGEVDKASAAFQRAFQLCRDADLGSGPEAGAALAGLAILDGRRGELAAAERKFRRAARILGSGNGDSDLDPLAWKERFAATLLESGEKDAAHRWFREVRQERIAAAEGARPAKLEQAAEFLVSCPIQELRDPAAAVNLTKRALAALPTDSTWRASIRGRLAEREAALQRK